MGKFGAKGAIGPVAIRAKEADFLRHAFTDKRGECVSRSVLDDTGDNIALTAYGASHEHFALAAPTVFVVPALWRFFALLPTKVSSTSIMPISC